MSLENVALCLAPDGASQEQMKGAYLVKGRASFEPVTLPPQWRKETLP